MEGTVRRFAIAVTICATIVSFPGLAGDAVEIDPERAVEEAKARAGSIRAQAAALAKLAWLEQAPEAVRERAREELSVFGANAMDALWRAAIEAPKEYKAEVVQVLLAAIRSVTADIPPAYVPALEDSVWFGDREARVLAIPELGRMRSFASVLPIIDAALEDPEVEQAAVLALGQIGDSRGRFYLSEALESGKPVVREQAAVALARLGAEGKSMLKSAMRSSSPSVRLAAVRALVPVATDEDVAALHEYVATHADDDPKTAEAIRLVALNIERAIEAMQAMEAAESGPR